MVVLASYAISHFDLHRKQSLQVVQQLPLSANLTLMFKRVSAMQYATVHSQEPPPADARRGNTKEPP